MAAFHRGRFEKENTKYLPSNTHRLALHDPLTAAAQWNESLSCHDFATLYLFLLDYVPVPDDQYLPTTDFNIGAEISSEAIRDTMQRVMNTGEGAFHAHLHEHLGRPRFSRVDMKDLPHLARSFQRASPESAHGGFLFSKDDCIAAVWLPGQSHSITAEKITVVGYPLRFYRGDRYVGR